MSSLARIGIAALCAILISLAASPASLAQSEPLGNIIQLSPSGGYLGIQMDDVTAANISKFKLGSERGVIVRSVVQGSPAEKAGIHEDDVILEYAGFPVWSSMNLSRLVAETPIGRKVDLAVSRDGKRITLTAEIRTRDGRALNDRMNPQPRDRAERDLLDRFFVYPGPDARDSNAARRPRLGLTLQPLSDQLAEHLGVPGKKGALVSSVLEGSPSAGKIRAGDVIVAADDKEIREPEDLTRLVRDKSEGKVSLKIIRDKKEIAVDVMLPAAPSSGGEGRGLRL